MRGDFNHSQRTHYMANHCSKAELIELKEQAEQQKREEYANNKILELQKSFGQIRASTENNDNA